MLGVIEDARKVRSDHPNKHSQWVRWRRRSIAPDQTYPPSMDTGSMRLLALYPFEDYC